jgi:hypothetical protein
MKRLLTLSVILAVIMSLNIFAASPRMILVEEATNASCGPCASQNPGFIENIKSQMDNKNIIPVIYHAWWPGSDVMYSENPDQNRTRIQYYGVSGVPSVRVNGESTLEANGYYAGAPGNDAEVNRLIDKYQGTSPLTINVTQTMNGLTATIDVEVSSDDAISGKKLHVACVEAYHYYENAGSNGEKEFEYVMRRMAPSSANGDDFSIGAGETKNFQYEVQLTDEFHSELMYSVAFVQDNSSKEVLQAGSTEIPVPNIIQASVEVNDPYLYVAEGVEESGSFTIMNEQNMPIVVDITVNTEATTMPQDWTVSFSEQSVEVPANGSVNVDLNVNAGATAGYASVNFVVTPQDMEGYTSLSATGSIGALHQATKKLVFVGAASNMQLDVMAMMTNEYFEDGTATVPLDLAVFNAFPADNFDFAMFSYSGTNSLFLSSNQGNKALSDATFGYINTILDNGGNVLINADLGLYVMENSLVQGQSAQPNSNAVELLQNQMGMEYQALLNLVQNNQLSSAQLKGISGTAFDGVIVDLNRVYSQSFPVYQQYVDIINVSGEGTPLMYFGDNQNQVVMVGYEASSGGKVIYSSFRTTAVGSSSSDNSQREEIVQGVVDFFGGVEAKPAILTVDAKVMFDETEVQGNNIQEILLENTGEAPLEITSIEIEGKDANSFMQMSGGNFFTIQPGETYDDLSIRFNPQEEGMHEATLVITSNNTGGVVEVELEGNATISSVKDGVAGKESIFTMQVGPNPVVSSGVLTYNVNGTANRNVSISIINSKGDQVATLVNGVVASGTHTVNINASDFSSGNYYLIGTADGYSTQLPLVIVK